MYVSTPAPTPPLGLELAQCQLADVFFIADLSVDPAADETETPSPSLASSPPVLSQSDFPSLPTAARPVPPKERVPLNLPNIQPVKPENATSSLSQVSSPTIETKTFQRALPSARAIIPLPPKPSAETLEAASKQESTPPKKASAPVASTPDPAPIPAPKVVPAPSPAPAPIVPPPQDSLLSKSAARKAKQKTVVSPTVSPVSLAIVEQEAVLSRKTKSKKPVTRLPKPKKGVSGGTTAKAASIDAESSQAATRPASPVRENGSDFLDEMDETLARFMALAPIVKDYYLDNIAFFNEEYVNVTDPNMGYESLVRALSALSNGTPINSLPVEAIDAAVTSFQQLLEMLSQTISDLLRLLPRLTWADTASLDSMLKDMLRSGDFMEEDGLDAAAAAAEAAYDSRSHTFSSTNPNAAPAPADSDDVAALTDALSKRARWMEAQLVRLESLHHDVNSAAVRVVMYFNDRGWDRLGQLPRSRSGDALAKFDALGTVSDEAEEGEEAMRRMTVEELEEALAVSLVDEAETENKLREVILSNKRLLSFAQH